MGEGLTLPFGVKQRSRGDCVGVMGSCFVLLFYLSIYLFYFIGESRDVAVKEFNNGKTRTVLVVEKHTKTHTNSRKLTKEVNNEKTHINTQKGSTTKKHTKAHQRITNENTHKTP
jgi:hypothetical protein